MTRSRKPTIWIPIYYRMYEMSLKGEIRRRTPGKGTRPGYVLRPWTGGGKKRRWVYLCRGGKRKHFTIDALKEKYLK